MNGNDLGYVDMADYTYHKIVTLTRVFTDLANTPDGKFYGLDDASIYEINVTDGTCTLVPIGTNPTFDYGNSMVSDRDGNLFVAGSADYLHKINLKTGEVTQVGLMGYAPGGDLCFSDGKLYMVTHDSELLEITLDGTRSSIVSTRLIGKLGVKGQVYSIGTNQYGICYLISTIGELAIIDLEDATTYVINNDIKGGLKEVNGIAILNEGKNDKDIEICGNGIDDDKNRFIDDNDLACRMKRGVCTTDSKEIFREEFGTGGGYGSAVPGLHSGAYTFSNTAPLQEGQYTVVDNPRTAIGNNTWKQMPDYSGQPGGRMMVINGSFFPGEIYRKLITGLCDQQQYSLSVKACSVISPELTCGENTSPIPSRIRFRIEDGSGNILGQLSEKYIPPDDNPNGTWKDYGLIFTLPANITTIQVVLLNDAPGGCGNDMAIDNIVLSTCLVEQAVKVNNGNSLSACANEAATFTADMTGSAISNPLFTWQKFDAATSRWADVSATTVPTFVIQHITSADAGQYRVMIRENTSAACFKQAVSQPVVLTVKALPDVQVAATISVCTGQPLQLNATTAAGNTIVWTDTKGNTYNGASPVVATAATAQQSGDYAVKVTAADNCVNTAKSTVTVQSTIAYSFTLPPQSICVGAPVQATVATGPVITGYEWTTDAAGTIIGPNTATPTISWNAPGTHTLTLKATGNCLQSQPVSQQATVVAASQPGTLSFKTPVCVGEAVALTLSGQSTGTVTWDLTGNPATQGSGTPLTATWAAPGKYTIKYTVNGSCGQTTGITGYIEVTSIPVVQVTAAINICSGEALQLKATAAAGTTYTWTDTKGNTYNGASPVVSTAATAQLSGVYTLKASAGANCVATAQSTVTVQNRTAYAFSIPSQAICVGAPVQATVAAGPTITGYEWSTDVSGTISGQNTATPTVQWNTPGTHTLTLKATGNCLQVQSAQQQANVVATALVGQLNYKSLACINEPVTFNVTNQSVGTISWSFSGNPVTQGSSTPFTATWTTPGQYTIQYTVKGSCGQTTAATRTIEVGGKPTVTLPDDTTLCKGVQLLLQPAYSNDVTGFSWQNSDFSANPVSVANEAGTYTLVVQNKYGCRASDAINVKYGSCGCEVYMPNAFTPNGDGKNDIFKPLVYCTTRMFRFSVYNRWGQLIFSTSKPGDGWNGSLNNSGGRKADPGTYVWVLEYEGVENTGAVRKTGAVTLLR
ncbi:gliding motility-associated C-terminal domain-containing protein [Chitinophaga jiangningensis]|uniref:gliding motility-associated C-terminal domain-containing protein n=1 Tax=Chitinophaga jiangningensis TaxID=1419482 RepID=UPI0015B57C6F|nr:gliding motility-associated C-terminal domain-containing protein [Chitinophaga jiangningensis]